MTFMTNHYGESLRLSSIPPIAGNSPFSGTDNMMNVKRPQELTSREVLFTVQDRFLCLFRNL